METAVLVEIEKLRRESLGAMRQKYREVFGEDTRCRHREHLFRRIAWRLQALAEGDLTERARERASAAPGNTIPAPCAMVTPAKASSKQVARPRKSAPRSPKKATRAKGRKARAGKKAASGGRTQSKGSQILEMIGRTKGATLTEIMAAAGWQAHSVRGFISTAGKKQGVKIESWRNESGDRAYRIAK